MLFADDVALTSHTEGDLQQLMNQFAHTCLEFGLIISIKKINVMGQDIPAPPPIIINDKVLEVTNHFTYLGLTITSNLSLDREIDKCIAKAAGVCPNWVIECGIKISWPWTPNSRCTRRVSSVPCRMGGERGGGGVNLGLPTSGRRTAWNAFTFAAYDESSASHGKTVSNAAASWLPKYASAPLSASIALARSFAQNEGWSHTKGCHAQWAGHGSTPSRPSSSAL